MKKREITVWIVAMVLAVVFILTGLSKVTGPSSDGWDKRFQNWGYPAGAAFVVGLIEIAAGLALPLPNTRRAAAAVLIVIMVGAVFTHVIHAEYARVIPPIILGTLAQFLAFRGRTS
jgi:putative oxidoreductase